MSCEIVDGVGDGCLEFEECVCCSKLECVRSGGSFRVTRCNIRYALHQSA